MVGEIHVYLSSFRPYEAEIYEQTTHIMKKMPKKSIFIDWVLYQNFAIITMC